MAAGTSPERFQVGPYLLEERIGEGGMAEVWRARHGHLGQPAAIKFLSAAYAHHPDAASRFYDEARIMFALHHPNLVAAKDFLEQDGQYFLVMELMRGGSLADVMDRQPGVPFELATVLPWMRGVLAALAYAHATPNPPDPDDMRPVFHRDIKPTNILFDDVGTPKICDFGIARVTGSTPTPRRRTRTGFSMGTGGYMSPEQMARPGAVDGRSDLYNVGVVLYELLTARLPFDEEQGFPDFNSPIPPRHWNPNLSGAVEEVILRALKFHPSERFQNAGATWNALEAASRAPAGAVQRQPTVVEPPRPKPPAPKPPDPIPPVQVTPLPKPVPPPPKPSRGWVWFFLILIAVIIGVVVVDQENKERARREAQRQEELRIAREAEERRLAEEAAAAERKRLEDEAKARETAAVTGAEQHSDEFHAWMNKRQTEMGSQAVTVTLANDCPSAPVHVAMRFKVPDTTDRWATVGWWKVDPLTSIRPGMATSNANVYFFAQNTTQTWNGSDETGSITVPVVDNRFVHLDGSELSGRLRKDVVMFRRVYNSWGNHIQRFTCN